jgi:hypothetical protein
MEMSMSTDTVPSRQDLIMESINDFFLQGNRDHLNQMLPILNQTAHISLRILDYFVTNYAKKKKIIYLQSNKYFNVFLNYKAQLKAYSKKQFDPFCRKMRKMQGKQIDESIHFEYDTGKIIETTVGQLNFFKWAIENGVLAYIVDHLTDIVEDMILSSKQKKTPPVVVNGKTSSSPLKSKKSDVTNSPPEKTQSISATKSITNGPLGTGSQKIKVVVSFS